MYDYVFVTHLPSFYKVNLYNEIAKSRRVLVVFVGKGSDIRTQDFVQSNFKFETVFLTEAGFEKRNKLVSLFRFARLICKTKYQRMVLGGWDLPEFWLALFLNQKKKNSLALESTANESGTHGLKGFIKKLFLSRVSTVFASGELHVKLLKQLNYSGSIKVTRGVGLINKPSVSVDHRAYGKKFLYLGRLSEEKNLDFLLDVFKDLPGHQLTLVGSGPLKDSLEKKASANVYFVNHVENEKIGSIFRDTDFLILPSLSETWGLVVEESLYYGRPVIISELCGASELINDENGFQFDPLSTDSLKTIILSINDEKYQRLVQNISKFSIQDKDQKQISSYLT